jgi:hypothetical protein
MLKRTTGRKPATLTSLALATLGASAILGGCTTDQAYASVRNAQRVQCQQLADATQRQRCLQDANLPQGAYQREREKAHFDSNIADHRRD